jgi:hypothetical protein
VNTGRRHRPPGGSRGSFGLVSALLTGLLLVSACSAPPSSGSGHAPAVPLARAASRLPAANTAPVTVTVTSTSTVPAKRTDISSSIELVQGYVTGAVWNHGRVPAATAVVPLDPAAATVTGRLAYSESAGRSAYSRTQTVETTGAGNAATFEMTTRSSSTDPRTVLDVLHRSGNPRHDYLLTGDAYRAVAPTAWVTVPAGFGNGLGCAVPGRQVLCQVSADLILNQALDPSMPTNTATSSAGTGSISSAITLRQLLALDIWRLRTAVAPLTAKATAAELDRTLIPVMLSYDARSGSTQGRPHRLTVNGAVAVGGGKITVDLVWDETGTGAAAKEIDLPVPTKALYTVLGAAAAQQLSAIAARSE